MDLLLSYLQREYTVPDNDFRQIASLVCSIQTVRDAEITLKIIRKRIPPTEFTFVRELLFESFAALHGDEEASLTTDTILEKSTSVQRRLQSGDRVIFCSHVTKQRDCIVCKSDNHTFVDDDRPSASVSAAELGTVAVHDPRPPKRRRLIDRCSHGKITNNCAECNGCQHGKRRGFCAICFPCQHGNSKYNCKICKACPHGKHKSKCGKCDGCPHGRKHWHCRLCSPCPHGHLKHNCKDLMCAGCVHQKLKTQCKLCRKK